jgi:hypothetical protein
MFYCAINFLKFEVLVSGVFGSDVPHVLMGMYRIRGRATLRQGR